ncbi:MAG: SHOCT domain-containing protein [Acidimicrobiia bacterium]|nr:SHOCT domain-containing protein [Acidimicrobiia bacterium]
MSFGEFGSGQAFLTVLYVFLFVIWFWLIISIFTDLFSDHKESGWAKFGWVLLVLIAPFFGAFIYLIVRGQGMGERAMARQKEAQSQFDDYVRQTAGGGGGGSVADELSKLADLKAKGTISDEEYDKAKAKLL